MHTSSLRTRHIKRIIPIFNSTKINQTYLNHKSNTHLLGLLKEISSGIFAIQIFLFRYILNKSKRGKVMRISSDLGRKIIGLLISITTIASISYGQEKTTQQLTGHIQDNKGAFITGANIVIQNKSVWIGAVTDVEGFYAFEKIPNGKYIYKASFIGYKPVEFEIEITQEQSQQIDITLNPESVQIEDIQVNGKSILTQIKTLSYEVAAISALEFQNSNSDAQRILNKIPGVRILEDGGLGSSSTFTLNGFSGDQVKFFMDGIPMDNYGSSMSLADIPVNLIERVEVYKGVVPVWLGADALGGAVNIITKKRKKLLDVSYSLGSFNTHRLSVNGAYTNANTGFTIRTNAYYNYSDNNYKVWAPISNENNTIVDTAEVERFHDRYESKAIQVESGWLNKSFADHLLLGILAAGNDKEIQTGATMKTVFGGITRNSQSLVPTLKYQKKDFLIDKLNVHASASFNFTQSEYIDTLKGVRFNWLGESFNSTSSNGQQSEDGELLRTFTTMKDKEASSQLNFDYALSPMSSLALNYAYGYFHRDTKDKVNPDKIENQFPKSLNKHILGLSYQFNWNDKWNTTAFGKLLHINAKSSKQYDFALPTQRTEEYKSSSSSMGFGLASSYFIWPSLQVKASYEHTYRLPSPEEMFGDGFLIEANPEIGPEQSHNYNIGALFSKRFKTNHQVNIGGSFIYRDTKDLIYTVVSIASPVTHFENLSKTRVKGVEGNIKYQWKDIFHFGGNLTFQDITDQAKLVYNESYTGTGYQKNFHYGFRLPNKPYLFGNANLGFSWKDLCFDHSKYSLNYHFNYVEKYFLTWTEMGSNNDDYIIPRQLSHDIELSCNLHDGKYNISVECRNLLNDRLYDKYYLQKPGRAFYIKLRYNL